jgi:hypothetical protein
VIVVGKAYHSEIEGVEIQVGILCFFLDLNLIGLFFSGLTASIRLLGYWVADYLVLGFALLIQ